MTDLPWSDCKVAFDCWEDDATWEFFGLPRVHKLMPEGWALVETDGAGARYVAVFRVTGIPTVQDGERVAALVRQADSYGKKKEQK